MALLSKRTSLDPGDDFTSAADCLIVLPNSFPKASASLCCKTLSLSSPARILCCLHLASSVLFLSGAGRNLGHLCLFRYPKHPETFWETTADLKSPNKIILKAVDKHPRLDEAGCQEVEYKRASRGEVSLATDSLARVLCELVPNSYHEDPVLLMDENVAGCM